MGSRVASVVPSRLQYHFVFDPNPAFKSAFALPGGYIIVGGGLLAIAQTEDESANVLAHEIEHVELGQVSRRVSELEKQKEIKNLELSEFLPGYTQEEELACDLNGQQLAAKAGYSPAGMLPLLETFKALRNGEPEEASEKHPSLAEPIAQAIGQSLAARPETIEDSVMVDYDQFLRSLLVDLPTDHRRKKRQTLAIASS